jgi:hypothetical protein
MPPVNKQMVFSVRIQSGLRIHHHMPTTIYNQRKLHEMPTTHKILLLNEIGNLEYHRLSAFGNISFRKR